MTTCPNCGAQNDPGNRFCDQCGNRLEGDSPAAAPAAVVTPDQPTVTAPVCPSCGAIALPGEAFCESCGADLSAVAAPAPVQATPAPIPSADAGALTTAQAACPNCGTPVLPGERFCDTCGADLSAAPAATPAAAPAQIPVTVSPDDATILAPLPAPVVEAPAAPVIEAPAAPVIEAPAAPVVEAPAAPVVEAPPALAQIPVAVSPDDATILAPPPVPATEAPPVPATEAPPVPAADAPTAPAVEAASVPAAPDQAAYETRRGELEGEAARQQQIITQFEQMQAMFGAAAPVAVTAGLAEAREALARVQADLAALQPPAPAVDPAVVKGFEDEIGRQRQIIAQFEQMQAMFGAAAPAAVTAGLAEAREALARAEAGLAALGVAPVPAPTAPATAAPAAPAVTEPAPTPPTPPTPPVAPVSPVAPAVVAPPAPAGPRLVVADGGAVLPLDPTKSEFVVGREDPVSNIFPEVDLTPYGGEMGGVSRQHARISSQGGAWLITDLNSTNYTRLDGARLEPNVATSLHDGAKVQFGRVVLTFHL